MLALCLVGLWFVIAGAGETPIGRSLRFWLVEAPARRLSRLRRDSLLAVTGVLALILIAQWLDADAGSIAAFASPDLAALLGTIDLGIVVDMITVGLAAVVTFGRAPARAAIARIRGRRPRAPRTHGTVAKPADNDDGDDRIACAA